MYIAAKQQRGTRSVTQWVKMLSGFKHKSENVAHEHVHVHGLRTPNEGINQRYLKNLADVADKICLDLRIWEWE